MARSLKSNRVSKSGRISFPVLQNLFTRSVGINNWTASTGVTFTANTADTTDPLGGNTAFKTVYDGSSTSGSVKMFMGSSLTFPKRMSSYTGSVYLKLATGSRPMILNINGQGPTSFTATNTWQRIQATANNWNPSFLVILDLFDGVGQNSAFTYYAFGPQMVNANWPGDLVQTSGTIVNTGNLRNIKSGRIST